MKPIRKAVMAVLVDQNQHILIGYSPRDNSYKFPQGGLEKNEDSLQAIQRELIEELNYHFNSEDIIAIFEEKVIYFYPENESFSAQELSVVKIQFNPVAELTPRDDEFENVFWIKPDELKKFDTDYRAEAYHKALQICKLL
jgi:8-oxo-dGTP pyrophosphatase MutT (NUDIX family)